MSLLKELRTNFDRSFVRLKKDLLEPLPVSYQGVAWHFYTGEQDQWYGKLFPANANVHPRTLRPYEIDFVPTRLYIDGMSQEEVHQVAAAELIVALQSVLTPSGKAFAYELATNTTTPTFIRFYEGPEREFDEWHQKDWVKVVTGKVGRWGVGLLWERGKVTPIIFPPGYNHSEGYTQENVRSAYIDVEEKNVEEAHPFSPKGEFPGMIQGGTMQEIALNNVVAGLPRDPNPNRWFRVIKEKRLTFWETVR